MHLLINSTSSGESNVPDFLLPIENITYLDISPLRKSPNNFFLFSSSNGIFNNAFILP